MISYRNVTFSGCFPTYIQKNHLKKPPRLVWVAVADRLWSFLLDATRLYGPVGRRRRPAQISSAFERSCGEITKSLSYTQLGMSCSAENRQKKTETCSSSTLTGGKKPKLRVAVRNIGKQEKESAECNQICKSFSTSMPYFFVVRYTRMYISVKGCMRTWQIHSFVSDRIHPSMDLWINCFSVQVGTQVGLFIHQTMGKVRRSAAQSRSSSTSYMWACVHVGKMSRMELGMWVKTIA